tara:strand:+ start:338 stop:565 length:228 start_codon:yes stop_codon:yes gene_type:complete
MELEITMDFMKRPRNFAQEVMATVPEIDLDTLEEGLGERFGILKDGAWMKEVLLWVQQYQKEESLVALRANRKAA